MPKGEGQRRWGAILVLLVVAGAAAADPSPTRQQELLHLLRHDCGSCHGMTLQGGLGPPLLPERIGPYDIRILIHTILQGRPGTPMPPWRGILNEADATWLAQQLQRGLPSGTR